MEIFYVLTKYVQSRLLQNCRMRERVKKLHYKRIRGKHFKIHVAPIHLVEGEVIFSLLPLTVMNSTELWPVLNITFPPDAVAVENFWKHCDKRRNFSFSTLFNNSAIFFFFKFLTLYFQRRQLQICCMWERVKENHDYIQKAWDLM